MMQRGSFLVMAAAIVIGLAWPREGLGQTACCRCNCGSDSGQCFESTDCTADCNDMDCDVESDFVCINGTFGGCDTGCNPICATETPTNTPTGTPTDTPTATPTNTPVPQGGSCTDTAQCAPGLTCQHNICTDAAPAPASSPAGLLIGLGLLAAIAALAIGKRRVV